MTRERIEDIREIVLPFVKNVLLKTNYENLGKSDAEEFTRDFNEVLDLAIEALEQEPTTKIEESNFSQEQYLADIQSAYDCGKSVIDKIRAEIRQTSETVDGFLMHDGTKRTVLQIIDKYKAESEDKE